MIKYSQVSDVFQRNIGHNLCLLKNKDKFVYKLNKTSVFLWELLQKPQSKENLNKALSHKYKIPQSQAQKDIKDFLKYYLGDNLIKKVSD